MTTVLAIRPLDRGEVIPPASAADISPAAYAETLGVWYGQRIDDTHRKTHGHYLTPLAIARFMGELTCDGAGETFRLLDPAAGSGVLAACACEALAACTPALRRIELVLYEIDAGLTPVLQACAAHLKRWLRDRAIELDVRIVIDDFVLANAGALEGGLFSGEETADFDAVICNPPYFKLGKSDPRAQACLAVVHGQPNVYGLFMALGAAVLRPGGRLLFITPRSYASGPYFQRFREWFFDRVQLTHLHVFESRSEAFDEVLQETVVTAGRRAVQDDETVALSVSDGSADIGARRSRRLDRSQVVVGDRGRRMLHLPADQRDDRIRALVDAWPGSLQSYGLAVSTGPVVAFRARQFLRTTGGAGSVPLLWLQHVKAMAVSWPTGTKKPEHVEDSAASAPLLLANRNYVVLRRFTAKEEPRRLVAAPYLAQRFPDSARVGFENHLNYVHRPGDDLDTEETIGLAAVLTSDHLDAYLRTSSGNTQVSATELRALPLPALSLIRRIGDKVRQAPDRLTNILAEELGDAS